ncbi:MAG: hypothetical protein LCH54_08100 [Bacteroidetes bacterium]|nr:hypothetical protein [Bacteroidota bacterium]
MLTELEKWYEDQVSRYEDVLESLRSQNPAITKNLIPCLPHIDPDYFKPGNFRVMHLGLNSYLSAKEYPPEFVKYEFMEHEDWWKEHINEKIWHHHYQMNHVNQIVKKYFYEPAEFRTNVIKIYLGSSVGQKDFSVAKQVKELAKKQTWEEFDLLHEQKLLPNLIFCYKPYVWEVINGYIKSRFHSETLELEKNHLILSGSGDWKVVVVQLVKESSILGLTDQTNIEHVMKHHIRSMEGHLLPRHLAPK